MLVLPDLTETRIRQNNADMYLIIVIKHRTIVCVIFLFIEYNSWFAEKTWHQYLRLVEWSRHCDLGSTWSIIRSNKKHVNRNQTDTYAALLAPKVGLHSRYFLLVGCGTVSAIPNASTLLQCRTIYYVR